MKHHLALTLLVGGLAVCRLPDGPPPPIGDPGAELWALVRTGGVLTLVCREEQAPVNAQVEGGWRALMVVGPLDFSLTGVLADLAVPLADAGVSIFALSTYDTDFILVKETALTTAIDALRRAGHRVGGHSKGGSAGK